MGSWEIQQSTLVAILHTDVTTVAWSFGLRNLDVPYGQCCPLAGMPYDMARNTACMIALERGFEWIFHLDSDVIPPGNAVRRLQAHNLPVISGLYARRSPPVGVPVMIKGGRWVTDYVPNSLVDVDVVGAGCLLIHRSVLENLPPQAPGKHWFRWAVDMRGVEEPDRCMSEDFTFARHVREKLGLRVVVDTSVVCRHVGLSEAKPGWFGPAEASPVT